MPYEASEREKAAREFELQSRYSPEKLKQNKEEILERSVGLEPQLEKETATLAHVSIEAVSLGKNPEKNEYAVFTFTNKDAGFFCGAVLDGVSGQYGAQEGSHYLKEELLKEFGRISTKELNALQVMEGVKLALSNYRQRLDHRGPQYHGAHTTLSLVFGFPHKDVTKTFCISVGDSRAYLKEKNSFRQITVDESLVEPMRGLISGLEAKVHRFKNLISHTARHPKKNQNATPQIVHFPYQVYSFDVYEGDEIWITSDGFTDQFREDEQLNEVADYINRQQYTPAQLIAASRLRTGQGIKGLSKEDDISVVKISIGGISTSPNQPVDENHNSVSERSRDTVKIFEAIQADKHLGSFLAKTLYGDLQRRDNLILQDVEKFYRQCPTLQDYEKEFDVRSFILNIYIQNGSEKAKEYDVAAQRF